MKETGVVSVLLVYVFISTSFVIKPPPVASPRRSVSCIVSTREKPISITSGPKERKEKLSEIELFLFVATGKKNHRSQKVTFLSPYLHMHICFVFCLSLFVVFRLYIVVSGCSFSPLSYPLFACLSHVIFCKKEMSESLLVV